MTRMRWSAVCVVVVCVALGSASVQAGTPADQQYTFAEQLARSGDAQFAILEFRRFVHMFPTDRRVPDARYALARTYLQQVGDVGAARRELAALAKAHPTSNAAKQAKQLDTLIEANKEFNYQPLRLFLGAAAARDRGDLGGALTRLDELVRKFPTARLAPNGLLLRAQVLEASKRTADAVAAYAELPARYPASPLVSQALLGQATATEARDGAKPHVADLYRQVILRYPNTPQATTAQARLAALRTRLDLIERQFAATDVRPFTLIRKGYFGHRTRYEVHVQVADGLTKQQVQATLEDALVKHYASRKDRTHRVEVEAYTPQNRRAGEAKWAPKTKPTYKVEKRRSKDSWRDALKGILR